MNDSPALKITLQDVKFVSVGTLINLTIEQLRELENEADKAVYDAGTRLEWIRGIITKKLTDEGATNESGS